MADQASAAELDRRLRILLPPEYHESYAQLEPKPMGSAGLQMRPRRTSRLESDLAGVLPPRHGRRSAAQGPLLGPGSRTPSAPRPGDYLDVIEELGRGITLASELPADDSPNLGWIRVQCHSDVMAGWMLRAITMENVAVRSEGRALDLPAAPHFRLDKEIKNVVTVVAKTCHYWMGHILANRRSTSASCSTHSIASHRCSHRVGMMAATFGRASPANQFRTPSG